MVAFLFEWLCPIIALVCLAPAFYFNDVKGYGKSTAFMLVSAELAGWYFWDDIIPINSHGMITSSLYLVGLYVIGGFITSFVYWIFFNWKAKENFDQLLAKQSVPAWATKYAQEIERFSFTDSLCKYLVINDRYNLQKIFDDDEGELKFNVERLYDDSLKDQAKLDSIVASVLPPRFLTCKSFIVGAGCSWPITVIWLLISRVVKQLIKRLVSAFGKTFDALSRLTFGKF
jgi:hypothetical protein